MQKTSFTSDELPPTLDEGSRFSMWREAYQEQYGSCEVSCLADRPFSARSQFISVADVSLVDFVGTIDRFALTSRHIAVNRDVGPLIGVVFSRGPMQLVQGDRSVTIERSQAGVITNTEPCEIRAGAMPGHDNGWVSVAVPRRRLQHLVANIDDLIAAPLQTSGAMALLERYLSMIASFDSGDFDQALAAHVDDTVVDLIALALGPSVEAREISGFGGLRAARIQDVLAEINRGYADQALSPRAVASRLGLSPRYIQDLLQETGTSFTERVLELRLQKARAMLSSSYHDRLKISDIAYACGFGNVSYFNQRFRRRFGCSPSHCRDRGEP